ncbi:pentatricopeptide repeat-containing protein at3g22150 chloroplastic [Phtheirospermum japonicum]|uniref:Pentatricopeptide repeat-containing protein at3g22150 chloroplastic n=1 Tax=Phtheirospermum japonicum TaxID=374723 RepID=A0A830CCA2_9LAMI|nr:pentatricopeptide repeat-containing protein at3g22150 chloroplastic [Phtheirospermum japonicum]
MLGRVGRVSEAYEFARKLGGRGDVLGIWGSVLSACKIHRDFELGKIVAEEGNWESVRSVRREMVERGVTKEVGCSWVDVSGFTSCFVSRDRKHPKCGEIYELLRHLCVNMKDDGYAPRFLSSEW